MESIYAQVGVRVIILKGANSNETTGWSMYMDKYIGKEARISFINSLDDGDWCLLDIDGVATDWWFPIRDLILASDRELLRDKSILK